MYTKKLFLLVALLVIVSTAVFAQTNNWTGGSGGTDWNNGGNWDNGVPDANSHVQIGVVYSPSNWPAITAASSCGDLDISGSGQLDLGATNANTLTCANVNIGSGGTLKGNAGSINVTGNWVRTGTFQSGSGSLVCLSGNNNTQTIDATSFSYLTIFKTGTGTASMSGDVGIVNKLNLVSGTLSANTYALNFTGNVADGFPLIIGSGVFTPGTGTVAFKNAGTANFPGGSYYNLSINKSTGTFAATSAMTVSGLLSIDAGSFATGAFQHNLKGSPNALTIASGVTFTATSGGTLNLNGSSATNIPAGVQYADLRINNSAGVTLSSTGATTVAGITIDNGTLFDNGNQIFLSSGTNTLSMSSTATLKLGTASTATKLPFYNIDNSTFESQSLNAASTVEYAGGSTNQNVAASANYGNLTLSGAGLKTFAGTTSIGGTLLIGNASVAATIGPTVVVTSNGTLDNNHGGTITVTGTGCLTVAGTPGTQYVGILSGSGNVGLGATAACTIDLGTINSTGIVVIGNGSGVITFVGSSSTASNFKDLKLDGSVAITPINNWTSTGTLTFVSSASLSVSSGRTIAIKDLQGGSGSIVSTGTGQIDITGTTVVLPAYNSSGTLTFTPGTAANLTFATSPGFTSTGTVTIAGAGLITNSGSPSALKTVNINNTATAGYSMPGNWTVTGLLTINSGAIFNLSAGTLTLGTGGSVKESGGVLSNSGTLTFNGSGAQTLTVGGTRNFGSIALNVAKSGGKLYLLGGNIRIGTITFTNTVAPIDMGGNTVTLVGSPNVTQTVNGYLFSGSVASTLSQNTAYTFPVGESGSYDPLTITAPSTNPGLTTVSYQASAPGGSIPSLNFASSGSTSIQVNRASDYYWTLNTTNSLAGQTDLAITLGKTVTDLFQSYDAIRIISRLNSGDAWTAVTGTYANTGSGNTPTGVVVSAATGAMTGNFTLAFGLASAVVNIGGLVYYGDLAGTVNAVNNVTVTLFATGSGTLSCLIPSAATTTGSYTFSQVSGIVTGGYHGTVSTFPAWSTSLVGTSSTDAVAARNTIVGRTAGAITSAQTMAIIAADVDNSGGEVISNATWASSMGGEVSFTSSPALTSITATDVMQILQRSAGTISSFARHDFYSTKYNTAASLLTDQVNQTIRIVAIGDASCDITGTVPSQLKKQQVKFENSGILAVDNKKAFSIPIYMTGESVEAAAFTLAFKYPANLVEFKGVVSSFEGLTAVAQNGTIGIYWIDMSGKKPAAIANKSEILSIKFQPKDGADLNNGEFRLELVDKNSSCSGDNANILSMSLSAPQVGISLPTEFALSQNYPNPFNPTTTFDYAVPEMGRVSIKIYNVLGQEVASLFDGIQEPGRYNATWNANHFASGVYIVRMTGSSATKDYSKVVKLMLLK